ncbi:MAG: hypothetical protein KDA83_19455 [Planctomycetales bacterium]|nr:hypothetical protein [Planctomycetales bacterium]
MSRPTLCGASLNRRRRARRAGLTLMELVVGTTSGAVLMAGLASTLFVMGQGASETSQGHVQFQTQTTLMRLQRDIGEAAAVEIVSPTEIGLTMPDYARQGSGASVIYSWNDQTGQLNRTENGLTQLVLDPVSSFSAQAEGYSTTAGSWTRQIPSAVVAICDLSASGSKTKVNSGKWLIQPLPFATSTGRPNATRVGFELQSLDLAIQGAGKNGTFSVEIRRLDSTGLPIGSPLTSWTIDESTLSGSSLTLFVEPPRTLPLQQALGLVVTPVDSKGDVNVYVTSLSPPALSGATSSSTLTPESGAISCVLIGRTIDQSGTWEPVLNVASGLRYELHTPRVLGGTASGTIALSNHQSVRERGWDFNGRFGIAPTIDSPTPFASAPTGWSVTGTMAGSDGEACLLQGALKTTTYQPAAGLVHARARMRVASWDTEIVSRLGVGNPQSSGLLVELHWTQTDSEFASLRAVAVLGTNQIGLGTIDVPAAATLDYELFADPVSYRVVLLVEDRVMGCWDLSEAQLGLSRSGLSSTAAVLGMEVSTGTSSVHVDQLSLEHLAP